MCLRILSEHIDLILSCIYGFFKDLYLLTLLIDEFEQLKVTILSLYEVVNELVYVTDPSGFLNLLKGFFIAENLFLC
jgi:hypothetical protein